MDEDVGLKMTVKYLRFCAVRITCATCKSDYLHDTLLDDDGRLGRLNMCPACQRRAVLGYEATT